MSAEAGRLALLVGTGVPESGATSATSDHDLAAVSNLLTTRFGFSADEVRVLRGPQADRAGILGALEDVVTRCAPQARVFFYFSGHGTLFADEQDTWGEDAALEPYAASSRADLIPDDLLFGWVARLWDTTSDIHLLLDCCFSGGIDGDDVVEAGEATGRHRPHWGGSGWPVDLRYAVLASSRHSLESAVATFPELGGRQHSLLTGSLVTLLRDATGPAPTYAELRTLLDARTAALGTPQQPQATGDVNREFLGPARRPSRRLVRVAGRSVLRAGAAHGVVAGSRWVLRPSGQLDSADTGGELDVVDVQPLRSTCRAGGAASGPSSDVVAVEVARPAGPSGRLPVVLKHAAWLAGPPGPDLVARLVERLSASPLLAVSPGLAPEPFQDDVADARVTVACSDAYLTVIVDGVLVTRLHDCRDPATAELLVQDLEEVARWAWAREVRGGDASADGWTGEVRLALFRASAGDGGLAEVVDPPDGSPPVLTRGDVLAVRVCNDSDRRVWPSLFHLGMDCSVLRLFPRTPQNSPLEPGSTRDWGFGGAGGWTVDRVAHGNDLRWPQPRRQAVKLWVTEDETDLAVVEAGPAVARAAGVVPLYEGLPVARTLRTADPVAGNGPDGAVRPSRTSWRTVTRSYLVAAGPEDEPAR